MENVKLAGVTATKTARNKVKHSQGIARVGYSPKKWVGVCGPLPTTLTLFMTSLQANLRPKFAIFPTLFMSY